MSVKIIIITSMLLSHSAQAEEGNQVGDDDSEVINPEFMFTAYDCTKPTDVVDTGFVHDPSCVDGGKVNKTKTVTYQVIQREKYQRVDGFVCSMELSENSYYCGAYDHMTKLTHLSFSASPYPVGILLCQEWLTTGKYTDGLGNKHELEKDAVNLIKLERLGRTYASDGQVRCVGQDYRFNQEILYHMVVEQQVKITIKSEKFKISEEDVIAHVEDKKLPCKPHTNGCQTPLATYIWPAPNETCKMALVRLVQGLEVTNDQGEAVFMSTDGSLVRLIRRDPVPHCDRILYSTNYDSIYLYNAIKEGKPFTRFVADAEISMTNYVKNRDDFLFHHVADEIEKEFRKVLKADCESRSTQTKSEFYYRHRDPGLTTWTQGEGLYSTTAGDITYTYKCAAILVQGLSMNTCYDALPVVRVQEGDHILGKLLLDKRVYMEPLTHRITHQAVEVPCLKKFPAKYHNLDGNWIAVLPNLHRTSPPESPSNTHLPTKIFEERPDFSKGGIYDDEEMERMERYREAPRTAMVMSYTMARQIGDSEYRGGPHIRAEEMFPELRDPRQWAKSLWTRTLAFLHFWGETAAIFVSLIAILRAINILVQWIYSLVVFKEVHGCTRQLCWTPCPGTFLLKQYRAYNKQPDPEAYKVEYNKANETVEITKDNYQEMVKIVNETKDNYQKVLTGSKMYPQGQLTAAQLAQNAQQRAENNENKKIKRQAPVPPGWPTNASMPWS
jgi:hypothetical protein